MFSFGAVSCQEAPCKLLISDGFNPEDLEHGAGRRSFVHEDDRFDFMKRLVAETPAGPYAKRRADLKPILVEGSVLDADQPSFAMERSPFGSAGLASHQNTGGLGTEFHGDETADVI